MALWFVEDVLTDEDARLDGLAETNFVRQQVSLNRILKHPANHFDLVRLQFDSRREKGRHPETCASLRRQRLRVCTPGIREQRCLHHKLCKKRSGVLNGLVPAYVEVDCRENPFVVVRKADPDPVALAVDYP